MLRIIIALIVAIFLMPEWVNATTYYVNTVTGSNAAAGTSASTAWKDLAYADEMVAANDTINVVAPATTPTRYGIVSNVAGPFTIQGTSNGTRAYILSSTNVSHGATINYLPNGDMEAWLDPVDDDGFAGAADVGDLWVLTEDVTDDLLEKETTIIRPGTTGTASCKIYENTSPRIYWNYIYLPAATAVSVSIWYYNGAADHQVGYGVTCIATGNELNDTEDGWANDSNQIDLVNSNGAWTNKTATWTTDASGGRYTFSLYRVTGNDGTSYFDDVTLTSTCAWTIVGGQNYYKLTPGIPSDVTPDILARCSEADWTASGATALVASEKVANVGALTAGTWTYDTGFVYYYPTAGEATSMATLHFELGADCMAANGSPSYASSINITHDDYTLKYLTTYTNNGEGFTWTGDGAVGSYLSAYYSYNSNFNAGASGTVVLDHCYGFVTKAEGNYSATAAAANMTITASQGWYTEDDGAQAGAGGAMNIQTSLIVGAGTNTAYNSGEGNVSNAGIGVEGAGSSLTAYNNTVYGCYGNAIRLSGDGVTGITIDVQNNIAWGSSGTDIEDVFYSHGAADTVTALDYNCYADVDSNGTDWDDVLYNGGHDVVADPLFNSATDYHLQWGSPCNGTGLAIVGVTTDYDGVTFKDPPSIGAYETIPPGGSMGLGLDLGL